MYSTVYFIIICKLFLFHFILKYFKNVYWVILKL